jgi:hypothetical protein
MKTTYQLPEDLQDQITGHFIADTSLAAELAQEIADFMDNHMELSPASINWGHVGNANRILQTLQTIKNEMMR